MATGVMHDVVVPADDGLVLKVPRPRTRPPTPVTTSFRGIW